jgi:nitrogenase-associated protein
MPRPYEPKTRNPTSNMSIVIFYEKPGCINNTKQKALLTAAGHTVEARNLLTPLWTPDRLQQFFGDRPIAQCFNRTAPAIKSGQVQPDRVDVETALALMVQEPLLIRRPLMQVSDRCEVGFDPDVIDEWIGLQAIEGAQEKRDRLIQQDLETCPNAFTTA